MAEATKSLDDGLEMATSAQTQERVGPAEPAFGITSEALAIDD